MPETREIRGNFIPDVALVTCDGETILGDGSIENPLRTPGALLVLPTLFTDDFSGVPGYIARVDADNAVHDPIVVTLPKVSTVPNGTQLGVFNYSPTGTTKDFHLVLYPGDTIGGKSTPPSDTYPCVLVSDGVSDWTLLITS